ncbi:MAG: hypothetical protein Kow0063_10710 [Anaerolineae bacterium]
MSERPIQVLIVDDEDALRAPLARWLADEYDYVVETASDGTEALALVESKGCFDVVLIDYLLPRPYNGLDLMKQIKERCFGASDFILFTGWGLEPRVGIEALKAGAYRYLAKPFDQEELAILIQSIVEMRRTEQKLAQTSREKAWLESLLEVSQSINSTLELDKVLQLILDEMKRVVIYDSASIQVMTDKGLQIIAGRGFADPDLVIGRLFPASEQYPNYLVWKNKVPMIEPELKTRHGTRRLAGWMGVPLIYRDRAIGVITLDSRTPGFYTEDDARVAAIFANQAAIAVENARLFSQIERQLDELDKLHHASGIMNSQLALDQVLQEVVSLASQVAGSDNTSLVLVDEGGNLLTSLERVSPAMQGIPPLHERARPNGTTHQVIRSGQPVAFHQVKPDEDHNPYLVQAGVASYVGLPLKTKERVVGVLFVHSLTPGVFKGRIPLLMTFANQAAIAIENARLHHQTQVRANQLHRLLEIGQQITRITDRPRGVLETIARMACLVASADCAVIYPYFADRKAYDSDNVSSFGLWHEFSPSDKPREYGKSVAARVIRQAGGMCIVPDVAQDAERGAGGKTLQESKFISREDIHAFVAVRLDFGTEPVGILFVNFRRPHNFSRDEIELIRLLANQAAVAIWNARLYGRTSQRLEQKVAELQTVSEVNQLITSTLNLDEVLSLILDKAMELCNVQNGVLQLVDDQAGELVVQIRKDPQQVPLKHRRLKMGEGITGKAAQEKRSIIAHNVTQPPWRDIYREFWPETRSELAVPLLMGEQCIGVLNLEHPQPGYFSEDEREIIEGLAAQAAIAIQNARLYEAVKRRSEHLKALHEASKAITAGFSAERKQVLDRIAQQAVERITGVAGPKAIWGAIALYDEATHAIRFESLYTPRMSPDQRARPGETFSLDREHAPDGRSSIAGRAILEGRPQRVDAVQIDPDYVEFFEGTQSELDVPLIDGDKIIGVLGVGSDRRRAFDEDDELALKSLADLAVIAIKNAEQVERLKRTDAVALMGAWGADVAHDVNREVGAIRRAVFMLKRRADLAEDVKERLQDIDTYASRLALPELPQRAPESGRVLEFMDAPFLDDVIRAEVEDLQRAHPAVTLHMEPGCEQVRVAIHERWLRRLVRHLIHNAAKTFPPGKKTRLVTIRTSAQESIAEVQVEDTGDGIQQDIAPLLFRRPVPHPDGRLGRGLLLVRFLAEQHGGYARLVWSRPGEGACFAFGIPLAHTSHEKG